jgi:hypothetical protein
MGVGVGMSRNFTKMRAGNHTATSVIPLMIAAIGGETMKRSLDGVTDNTDRE